MKKMKEIIKKPCAGKLLYLLFLSLLVLLAVRIYQVVKIIDPETNFYSIRDISIPIINIGLFLVCAVFILISFFSAAASNLKMSSNPFILGIVSVITGIALMAMAAFEVGKIAMAGKESIDFLILLKDFCQIVSGYFFIKYGIDRISGAAYNKAPLSLLLPVVWAIFRMIKIFTLRTTFVNVSSLLYELFFLSFAMLFFLSVSRYFSGIEAQTVKWRLFGFGLPCVVFAFVYAIPSLITLIRNPSLMSSNIEALILPISYFFIGVFITTFLISIKPVVEKLK